MVHLLILIFFVYHTFSQSIGPSPLASPVDPVFTFPTHSSTEASTTSTPTEETPRYKHLYFHGRQQNNLCQQKTSSKFEYTSAFTSAKAECKCELGRQKIDITDIF